MPAVYTVLSNRIVSRELSIFGYGSLVWRPAFAYASREAGYVRGYARRFWQGSTDHRGVPEAPGRVVTLTQEPQAECWGMLYRVGAEDVDAVVAQLDWREKGGYRREDLEVVTSRGPELALTYVAMPGNPNYLGPASIEELASQIQHAVGPSGANVEYVLRLEEALRDIGGEDEHVFAVAQAVRRLVNDD